MPHSEKLSSHDRDACREVARLYYLEKSNTGLTQKELARMIGVSPQTISAVVTGKMPVSLELAAEFASVFGVPVNQILPKLERITESNDTIARDFNRLDSENQQTIARMIRKLLDKQVKP